MLDALLCAADDVPSGSAATSAHAQAAVTDAAALGLPGHADRDAQGVCQHGHVHSAPALTELQPDCAAPKAAVSVLPRPRAALVPPSIAGPGLERPPRV
jgi:hypothetical protein